MKKIIFLFVIFISLQTSAKNVESYLLKKVFSDSIMNHYMSEYGGINAGDFSLSYKTGYYYFDEGTVKFEDHKRVERTDYCGAITKFKIHKKKAIVKINFTGKNNYYSKVILARELGNDPWRIKSRLIYKNLHITAKQPRLFHYSVN